MNYKETAKGILEHVGGVENISNMSHCATRLRLNLKDETLANDEDVKAVDGVVNVINKAGQYQVLIGIEVPHVFEEFEKLVKGNGNVEMSESNEDEGIISKVFSAISAIFAPLLPALAGSGILRGLLILAVQLGMIKEGSGTYTILYSTSMAVFYFLPVLLAFTSGKRFGASPYISALIGAALLHPDLIGLMGDIGNGATTSFFGIPTVLMNYNSTVLPIIITIWAYSFLYKFLDRKVPETLKLVIVPLVSLVVMVPLTLIVIGPIGVYARPAARGGHGAARILHGKAPVPAARAGRRRAAGAAERAARRAGGDGHGGWVSDPRDGDGADGRTAGVRPPAGHRGDGAGARLPVCLCTVADDRALGRGRPVDACQALLLERAAHPRNERPHGRGRHG